MASPSWSLVSLFPSERVKYQSFWSPIGCLSVCSWHHFLHYTADLPEEEGKDTPGVPVFCPVCSVLSSECFCVQAQIDRHVEAVRLKLEETLQRWGDLTEGQLWSKCLTEVRGENLTFISAAPLGSVMFVSGVQGPQVTAVCLTCAHADLRSKLSVCLNWTRWALFYLYEELDWTEHAQCVHTVCSSCACHLSIKFTVRLLTDSSMFSFHVNTDEPTSNLQVFTLFCPDKQLTSVLCLFSGCRISYLALWRRARLSDTWDVEALPPPLIGLFVCDSQVFE